MPSIKLQRLEASSPKGAAWSTSLASPSQRLTVKSDNNTSIPHKQDTGSFTKHRCCSIEVEERCLYSGCPWKTYGKQLQGHFGVRRTLLVIEMWPEIFACSNVALPFLARRFMRCCHSTAHLFDLSASIPWGFPYCIFYCSIFWPSYQLAITCVQPLALLSSRSDLQKHPFILTSRINQPHFSYIHNDSTMIATSQGQPVWVQLFD